MRRIGSSGRITDKAVVEGVVSRAFIAVSRILIAERSP
jgi:hypothetical protein